MPEYLYHYTSLESLKKILENKTFRFSSLSVVDDMNESNTKDFGELGRFVLVNCWTTKENESSSLWSEYTEKKGVRIKLPSNIFPTVMEVPNLPYGLLEAIGEHPSIPKFPYTLGVKELEIEKGITVMPRVVDFFPVTYTEDPILLDLSVYSNDEDRIKIEQSLIGRFKKKSVWEHQEEWRYKLFYLPFSIENFQTFSENGTLHERVKTLAVENTTPFDFIDLPVDEEKFKDMEIVMSSLLTNTEIDTVNELVEMYNPSARVKKSTLMLRK